MVYGNINTASDIESLIIPDTYENKPVTKIKDNAFYGCSSLENIVIQIQST